MRVWFFGTSAFAVPSLERLVAEGHAIDCCVTQPDRPQGRGQRLEPSPVKQAALRLELSLLQPERLAPAVFQGHVADLGVVVAYGQLIQQAILALPHQGMIGVHPSLLPKYRGAAPINWALLKGETTTGMSIFRLVERLDAGEILLQESITIQADEDAEMLGQRLALRGADCLARTVRVLESGRASSVPQDESKATYAPKLTKAQGRVDWHAPAREIASLIRAMVPWPGAWTLWCGQVLKLWQATVQMSAHGIAPPGTVLRAGPEELAVGTGRGVLIIQELQAAGKRRMSARDFLAGHHINIGEQLG